MQRLRICAGHTSSSVAYQRRFASQLAVRSQYASQGIDLQRLAAHIEHTWRPGSYRLQLDRDWAFIRANSADFDAELEGDPEAATCSSAEAAAEGDETVYMCVSRRGSLVTVAPPEVQPPASGSLAIAEAVHVATTRPLPRTNPKLTGAAVELPSAEEGADLLVDPQYPRFSGIKGGQIVLQELDLNGLRVVSSCMAQTVSLQFFEGRVDQMHDAVLAVHRMLAALPAHERGEISSKVTEKLPWSPFLPLWWMVERVQRLLGLVDHSLPTSALYQQLGVVNDISNRVVLSGLRSTVRPGSVAWKEERYSELQELLWDEYDLEDRYAELQRRLTYVDDSIRFALEVSKDNKSLYLERLIVVLISAELLLAVVETDAASAVWQWVLDQLR